MRLSIDTGSVKFAAAGPAEPVLDYETRSEQSRRAQYVVAITSGRVQTCAESGTQS